MRYLNKQYRFYQTPTVSIRAFFSFSFLARCFSWMDLFHDKIDTMSRLNRPLESIIIENICTHKAENIEPVLKCLWIVRLEKWRFAACWPNSDCCASRCSGCGSAVHWLFFVFPTLWLNCSPQQPNKLLEILRVSVCVRPALHKIDFVLQVSWRLTPLWLENRFVFLNHIAICWQMWFLVQL